MNLVIVGNDSGERKAIQERIDSAKLSANVTFLSGLSDLEVRCAYKLCSLFVFPSSYEGFGIPILEAMAAGCPMVLSDIPVFREITQDKGVYFPHDDVEAMAAAIDDGTVIQQPARKLDRLWEGARASIQFQESGGAVGIRISGISAMNAICCGTKINSGRWRPCAG